MTYLSEWYLSYYYTAISICYFMCTVIMPCQKLLCRFMKHEVRNLNFICEGLDNGNICPACPKVSKLNTLCILGSQLFYYTWQNSGSLFISMDALFGLPRKKSAGKSVRTPLTGDLFFEDQAAVDEYVSMHSKEKHATTKSKMVRCSPNLHLYDMLLTSSGCI